MTPDLERKAREVIARNKDRSIFAPHLMIVARFRAALHCLRFTFNWPELAKHRIWRAYTLRGWHTHIVVCECGADFGQPQDGKGG